MIKSISPSAINTYEQCPYAFYLLYVVKIIQQPSPALKIGSAFHKATELFHSTDKKPAEILDIIKKEFIENKDDIKNFSLVRLMAEKYFNDPIEAETIGTEVRFRLDVPGLPVSLNGVMDRVIPKGFIDYKTTSEDYTEDNIKNNAQWLIYPYAYKRLYHEIPKVIYYITNKKKIKKQAYKPQVIELTPEDNKEEVEEYLREFYKKVMTGDFPKCRKPYCLVRKYCK